MRKRLFIISFTVLMIGIIFIFQLDRLAIVQANSNLNVENMKLLKEEKLVLSELGEGRYLEGMGGYGREYSSLGVLLGFSDDSDSNAFHKVSSIETENENHSLFGVSVGDEVSKLSDVLKRKAYSKDLYSNLYVKRELHISYDEESGVIKKLRIWYIDNKVMGRLY
ncbi:hypothetical protein ACERII_06020 [Evansella sp. AB-rgal1]|uniref:hypothetical protein n=1 Tax=Evansella sp. AB-rgal1 TaxID=3242696 RepID=UPI00359E8525